MTGRGILPGAAESAATAAKVAGLGPAASGPFGTTGLTVARIGFGGYRVDDQHALFAEALRKALGAGCNLIDTSTNYTDGGSERLIGRVLGAEVEAGRLRRAEVVVVSKIGYVQGQNLDLAEERERAGRPFPEMVKYMDGCWHCLHPQFLADQLDRSLARLGLGTLDVCLLHNPEYFFSDALRRGAMAEAIPALRDELYRRLGAAFAYFERQVAAGQLRFYGVSSNTCTAPAGDPEMTSLDRMLAAAERAGGPRHHFRVLELPMNLIEAGGLLELNNGGATVLARAQARGLGVLLNRPLNAIVDGRLLRFTEALSTQVAPLLDPALPPALQGAPLSQKVLQVLRSVPAVSCVLLGMRRPAYVDDAVAVLRQPPLDPEVVGRAFAAFAPFRTGAGR